MLYRKLINPCSGLLHRSSARLYIYLQDHNQLINPRDSRLKLSYSHPKNLVPEVPKHNFINFKLDPDLESLMERLVFEQYKNKILRGQIDEVKEVEPDPLWGEEAPPTHYYARLSKIQLMSVSHPQNRDFIAIHEALYSHHFKSAFSQEATFEAVQKADLHELVEISLKARRDGQPDGSLFFAIETRYDRGHKLHLLNTEELIKLKYAFDEDQKFGSPIFHEILSSLLREDITKMNSIQLRNLFHACRYSNPGKTNLQRECLEALVPHYKTMSFTQKVDFLFTFAMSCKPLRLGKKVHKRRMYEFKQYANAFLFNLNIWDLELTHDSVSKLIYSLAKLRFQNTKFLSIPIRDFISNELEAYCQDKDRLWQAIAYLPELENGEGVADQQLMGRLREIAVSRWGQFTKIQQIRMIHSFWNLGLFDEAALELYKGIELEADSTLLYYACQIEFAQSSEREWQIIQCLAHLEYIPLPYYIPIQRFYNSIKISTKWNLTPVADKLRNTEYYFNVMRLYDSMYQVLTYRQIRQFQEFTKVSLTEKGAPIENLELAHYGFPTHQVSLDIITPREYIPGTKQLKQTYLNKVRSLKNFGWKHLAYDQQELRATPAGNIVSNIIESYLPYVEEQKVVIDYQDYQRSEEIDKVKLLAEMDDWEVKDLNQFENFVAGKIGSDGEEGESLDGPELTKTHSDIQRAFSRSKIATSKPEQKNKPKKEKAAK